jgi:biofilm PGA synthesis N-glycosyltransferase PgaC
VDCLVIVPFLNEGAYLPTFLASLDAQTRRPDRVVLVDDGSTDDSPRIAGAFCAERPWAVVRRRPPRPAAKDRLRGAPELEAFLWALSEESGDYDVVAKMDADLKLSSRHVETVLAAFAADPRLGMAGTYLSSRDDAGRLRVERHPADHVRGPTRFYRRICLGDVLPLPVTLGWDGADEVRARARGWRTRSLHIAGEPSLHLRPTGGHDGRLRAHARWGECAYAVGQHPLGVAAGAVLRMRDRPQIAGGLAYWVGWASAPLRGVERMPEDIRRAKRAEQRERIAAGMRSLRP